MNNPSNSKPTLTIYESTWIGLLQSKVGSIKNFQELTKWSQELQEANHNIYNNIKYLLSEYESLIQQKDQLFKDFETDEAKIIIFKDYVSKKTMALFPVDSNIDLRQKYISKFIDVIPNFSKDWNDDVDFREGNDSLIILFVFLNGNIVNYDEKTLTKIFEIIDSGLMDTHEIVQAEIVRGLLINFVQKGLEKTKYVKYMPENTFIFCKKINSIWKGERIR